MTVIIDDKDKNKNKIPYEEYTNPQITVRDIIICSIRQIPLPIIVNNIYKPNPDGDSWSCKNCKTRGDKWYLMTHSCKALRPEKPKTQLEIQQAEEEIQRRLEASKWICPYCKEVTDRFYKKLHYRCLPEDKKRELENQEEESKFETCIYCNKLLNPYYKNFHYCQAMSEQQKVVSIQQKIPNRRRVGKRLDSFSYAHDLSEYLKHKAVLEEKYWILYIYDKRIGPVEKATPEELTSWDPNPNAEKNEGSDQ